MKIGNTGATDLVLEKISLNDAKNLLLISLEGESDLNQEDSTGNYLTSNFQNTEGDLESSELYQPSLLKDIQIRAHSSITLKFSLNRSKKIIYPSTLTEAITEFHITDQLRSQFASLHEEFDPGFEEPLSLSEIEGDYQKNEDQSFEIRFTYRLLVGELIYPTSGIKFKKAFPGNREEKLLTVISTYNVPVDVINIKSSDPRFIPEKINSSIVLQPNERMNIAKITFDPSKKDNYLSSENIFHQSSSPDHFPKPKTEEAKAPNSLPTEDQEQNKKKVLRNKSSITSNDLNQFKENQRLWENIDAYVSAEITLETSYIQNTTSVKAQLYSPSLVDEDEINFKEIQNGKSEEHYLHIINPSEHAITAQLFLANSDLSNIHSLPSSLNSSSSPYKCAHQTHSQTIRNINLNITKEHFNKTLSNEEYCCLLHQIQSVNRVIRDNKGASMDLEFFIPRSKLNIIKSLEPLCNANPIKEISQYTDALVPRMEKHLYPLSFLQSVSKLMLLFDFFNIWGMGDGNSGSFNNNGLQAQSVRQQQFYLHPDWIGREFIIGPKSSHNESSVIYVPNSLEEHNMTLFIKNNLTILYPVYLKGRGSSGYLQFVQEYNPISISKPKSLKVLIFDVINLL